MHALFVSLFCPNDCSSNARTYSIRYIVDLFGGHGENALYRLTEHVVVAVIYVFLLGVKGFYGVFCIVASPWWWVSLVVDDLVSLMP